MYDVLEICPKCGGVNKVTKGSFYEGEAETECESCGHKDYWSYGRFEPDEYEFKGKHYTFENGKFKIIEGEQ